jgi:hypothetical protein
MSIPDHIDRELDAIQRVFAALEPLDDEARVRVLSYIASRLDIDIAGPKPPVQPPLPFSDFNERPAHNGDDPAMALIASGSGPQQFNDFADLYDAASPVSHAERVLVAGYWLQVLQGGDSFDSQTANTLLKNLGHGIPNVTKAIDALKAQTPALALQLKKAGTSQQARKTYKITVAGMKAVGHMLEGFIGR